MKTLMRLAVVAAALIVPAIAHAEGPAGTWRHPDSTLMKFYNCGGGLCAQIVKNSTPGQRDVNNPDSAKKDRPLDGLVVMSGAQKVGGTEWSGKLYNPDDGKTYSGKIVLQSNTELKLQGCVLGGLVCKGETLSRVGD
ncbi:uncharacterized protein (DUF2147 family) [Bradyrhizobium sp. USDA 4369]